MGIIERNIDVREEHRLVASCRRADQGPSKPAGDLGTCPDQGSNWRLVALKDDAQPTEPHWSGFFGYF